MSYTVLARKWRPDHFDEVVGQEHVARTLINSIEQDRVAHSYLFCGARGVGKTSTARILAKAMNCEEGPTARPCYNCASCEEISNGQSVDVFEIDGASNRGINEIRELREGVRYAPSRDEHKIYIIDEVHMLTTEAFNALLKTLEEPPPHAIFIFATTEPQKIPVTILSRCQRFDFKRISQRDIVGHLQQLCEHEGFEADKAALQIIARQANGGMRDALSLLDQIISFSGERITEREIAEILGVANRKHLFELSEAALSRDAEKALMVLDEVNRYGYDLQQFASELVTHFRDLMVTAVVDEPEKVTQLTESELEVARSQVQGLPSELLHRYFSVMVDGAQEMNRSGYPKLIFEMTLVRLSELEPMEKLDLLVDRLELLETTLEDDADGDIDWPESAASSGAKPSATAGGQAERESSTDSRPEKKESTPSPSRQKPSQTGGDDEPMFQAPDGVGENDNEAESSPSDRDSSKTGAPDESESPGKDEARTDESVRAASGESDGNNKNDGNDENNKNDGNDENNGNDGNDDAEDLPNEVENSTGAHKEDRASSDDDRSDQRAPTPARPPIDAYESGSSASTTSGAKSGETATAVQETKKAAASDKTDEVSESDEPNIPQPLSPSEVSEVEVPEVDQLSDPGDRWRAVVEYLRHRAAPVAATCEHGHLHKFEDGVVGLRFTHEFIGFAQEETRRALLDEAVHRLFGDEWTVEIERRDEDDPVKRKTLAQERQEDIDRRRAQLQEKMRTHSAVQTARELFGAGEPRVSVQLYDE